MSAKIKEHFIPGFMIVYYITFISWIFVRFVINYNKLSQDYVYSNRLINYRGGFIRRGLSGEIIWRLSAFLNISPLAVTAVISALTCIILVCIICYKMRKYSLFILTLPFFFGEIVFSDWYVRTDPLILLVFVFMLFYTKRSSTGYSCFFL